MLPFIHDRPVTKNRPPTLLLTSVSGRVCMRNFSYIASHGLPAQRGGGLEYRVYFFTQECVCVCEKCHI